MLGQKKKVDHHKQKGKFSQSLPALVPISGVVENFEHVVTKCLQLVGVS
jgi:hypothetical protein